MVWHLLLLFPDFPLLSYLVLHSVTSLQDSLQQGCASSGNQLVSMICSEIILCAFVAFALMLRGFSHFVVSYRSPFSSFFVINAVNSSFSPCCYGRCREHAYLAAYIR